MRKRAILALLAAGLVLVLGLGAAALVLFGSDDPVQRAGVPAARGGGARWTRQSEIPPAHPRRVSRGMPGM